jgi:orotidine-5'-phosphate decarboxylase
MTMVSFGERLRAAMDTHGPLCVGIDPHRELLHAWGLPFDLGGIERFTRTCVEAFGGAVACVKPQSAFFEVFGSPGVAILERALRDLREAGTLTILDAKRGDIGSTMAAYAEAFLGKDAPAPADAVTVSPYLGYGALRPAIDLAQATGRGVFVLALTSNPEGPSIQHARAADGRSVAQMILDGAAEDNAQARATGGLGSVGLVIGATVGTAVADLGLDLGGTAAPLLAPGLGAQGASAADVRRVFAGALDHVLPTTSRGVLAAGPSVAALRAAARAEGEAVAGILGSR